MGRRSPEGRTQAVPSERSVMGGAVSARPETRRMLSGIRQAAACMTRGLAYPPAPLQGPSPGLLRLRPGQAAGDAVGAGSGTDPDRWAMPPALPPKPRVRWNTSSQIMSATGPARWFRPHPHDRWLGTQPGPVAGFARRSGEHRPPAEPRWLPPPRPVRPTSGRPVRGIPSRLARNVRDPSGSGSKPSMTWAWRMGIKPGRFC